MTEWLKHGILGDRFRGLIPRSGFVNAFRKCLAIKRVSGATCATCHCTDIPKLKVLEAESKILCC